MMIDLLMSFYLQRHRASIISPKITADLIAQRNRETLLAMELERKEKFRKRRKLKARKKSLAQKSPVGGDLSAKSGLSGSRKSRRSTVRAGGDSGSNDKGGKDDQAFLDLLRGKVNQGPEMSKFRSKPADILVFQGRADMESGEYEKAAIKFETALTIDPKHYEAASSCGKAYFQSHELELALDMYTRCVQIAPKNPEAYYNRGTVYSVGA